jgi:hypothetical protein
MNQRRLVWTTIAVFILPMLVELAVGGVSWPFAYLASDSFYYLTVARNLVRHGLFSFDGTRLTNGFHPLWQLLSAATYGVSLFLPESAILSVVVLCNAAMIAVALWLLGRALSSDGKLTPLFAILPVGFYALLVSPLWIFGEHFGMQAKDIDEGFPPLYGTLWSYANGMESSVVIVFFAAALACRDFDDRKRSPWFGLILAGMTLGRLDHGMIAASILGCRLLSALRSRRGIDAAVISGVTFALPMALYLAVNHHWFHMLLPVSGRLKSTFPHVNHHNLARALSVFLHPLSQGWYRSYRIYQMLIPVAAAALAPLVWYFRRGAVDRFLVHCSPGVAGLGLYNLFYVDIWEQGHWYFPVSTLFVGILILRALGSLERSWLAPACAAICVVTFARYQHRPPYHQRLADVFFVDGPALKRLYPTPPALYEYDDGIVAFSTGFPTLVTKGYTLDPEAFNAYRAGHLTPLALSRGHNRFVSVSYFGVGQLDTRSTSDEIGGFLKLPDVPPGSHFSVEYRRDNFIVVHVQ